MKNTMLLYDYKCLECETGEERLVLNNKLMEIQCSRCDGVAVRQLAAPRSKLDGTDPGFPDAHEKWTPQHEKAGFPVNRNR